MTVKQFQASVPFLCLLKTSENRRFSGIFRGYRNGTLAWNQLNIVPHTEIFPLKWSWFSISHFMIFCNSQIWNFNVKLFFIVKLGKLWATLVSMIFRNHGDLYKDHHGLNPFKSIIFWSHRNQWIDLNWKTIYWFLCDRNFYVFNLLTSEFSSI